METTSRPPGTCATLASCISTAHYDCPLCGDRVPPDLSSLGGLTRLGRGAVATQREAARCLGFDSSVLRREGTEPAARTDLESQDAVISPGVRHLYPPLRTTQCACGGTGIRAGLRNQCLRICEFESHLAHAAMPGTPIDRAASTGAVAGLSPARVSRQPRACGGTGIRAGLRGRCLRT